MGNWYDDMDEQEQSALDEDVERAMSHGEDAIILALPEPAARVLNAILWNTPGRLLGADLAILVDDLVADLCRPTDEELNFLGTKVVRLLRENAQLQAELTEHKARADSTEDLIEDLRTQ